jgi:phage repressor protein C with HTH and peptisase S24 domain
MKAKLQVLKPAKHTDNFHGPRPANFDQYLGLPREFLSPSIPDPSVLQVIRVQGDAMSPAYLPYTPVLIDPTRGLVGDGDYIIKDAFDNLSVKRIQVILGPSPQMIKVINVNPAYPSEEIHPSKICIVAKVVGVWQPK